MLMSVRVTLPFLLALLLLTGSNATGQSWAPVSKDQVYYYQADTADHITHQLQVDSTYSRNGNQVQVLNTGLQRCDTCSADNLPVVGDPGRIDTVYYHIDHPFFWQRTVVDSQNRYYFYGNRDFILAPDAPKETTWPFRPDTSVTARIDSTYQTSVFGRTDSVKRIRLSSGQTLLLTKNHGIMEFPAVQDGIHYQLTGIKSDTNRMGNTFGFKEIYDWQVGDVFQYKYDPFPRPRDFYRGSTTKREILEKNISTNKVTYKVESKELKSVKYRSGTREALVVDTSYIKFTTNSLGDCYPGEVLQNSDIDDWGLPPLRSEDSNMVTRCRLTVDSNGRLTKTIGAKRNFSDRPINYYKQARGTIHQAQGSVNGDYGKQFKEGLGLTSHYQFYFEAGSYRKLIGYMKGDSTVGKVLSDQRIRERDDVGVSGALESPTIVYPNPVQRTLHLENLSPAHAAEIRLYNQMGQRVRQYQQAGAKARINTAGLEPGLYILKIQDGSDFIQRKVLKR